MKIDVHKFVGALKGKYGTPKHALAALGFDEALDPIETERNGSAGGDDQPDDKEARLKKFREFLLKAGFSTDDIQEAVRIATTGGEAKDVLPANALAWEGGMHGRISGAEKPRARGGMPAMDETGRHALEAKLDRHFGISRIVGEAARRQDRRQAADAARPVMGPSRAAVAAFTAKYPGVERIG